MRTDRKLIVVMALIAFAADQASKWVILLAVMDPPRTLEVLPFFNLVLTYNRGVSFGILASDLWFKPYLLSVIALLVIAALLWWLRENTGALIRTGQGLIVGGALGNVLDRFLHPGVVDFLDFHAGGWHWPAFNIADSCIFIGVVAILLDGLFDGRDRGKTSG